MGRRVERAAWLFVSLLAVGAASCGSGRDPDRTVVVVPASTQPSSETESAVETPPDGPAVSPASSVPIGDDDLSVTGSSGLGPSVTTSPSPRDETVVTPVPTQTGGGPPTTVEAEETLRSQLLWLLETLAVSDGAVAERCLGAPATSLDFEAMDADSLATVVKLLYPCASAEIALAVSQRPGVAIAGVPKLRADQQVCLFGANLRALGTLDVEEIVEVMSGRRGSREVLLDPIVALILPDACGFDADTMALVQDAAD